MVVTNARGSPEENPKRKTITRRLFIKHYPHGVIDRRLHKKGSRIVTAQNLLPQVNISSDFQLKISQICSELEIEGLRGDIVSTRAAKALAAFEDRTEVTLSDVQRTIPLCLRHRLRRDPMESINSGDKIESIFQRIFSTSQI